MKRLLLSAILLFAGSTTYAQEEVSIIPREKVLTHQIGVQMNELIRQVFNFNNNGTNVNNPYLLIYHVTHKKTGLGLRLGVGPEIRKFKDDDGITETDNDIYHMNLRIGLEKTFQLTPRWSAGAGADFIYSDEQLSTYSKVRTFDSVETNITSRLNTIGTGGMAWLRYHITPNVLIGTETSFYYTTGDFKQDIAITRIVQQGPGGPKETTSNSNVDNKQTEGTFSLPVAFYLIVRF